MSDTFVYQTSPPSLLPLYLTALRPESAKARGDVTLPPLSASLFGASTDNGTLKRYEAICGFAQTTRLPTPWPHVMAFPLHLRLLTAKAFPLPLLGLVHLRNTITQHRTIGAGELLDLRVRLGTQEHSRRGIEFDLITEAYAAGTLVWEESSITLYRQTQENADTSGNRPVPPKLTHYPNRLSITAPESIGRQYARVSGDSNPIHMHALSAKAFGFPKAIAHGMWSQARVLALLEQQEGWRQGPVRVSCQFKTPLLLPGTAQVNWRTDESGWDYQLLNSRGDAPHLSGRIDWL